MTLPTALAQSCDTYFYELGYRIYHEDKKQGSPEQKWAGEFGFGKTTGIDIAGENPGVLPTLAYRERTYQTLVDKQWRPGDSVLLAIGQGDLLVTPLQIAVGYAAIANGGYVVTPHVGDQIEDDSNGTHVIRNLASNFPRRKINARAGPARGDPRGPRGGHARPARHLGAGLRELPDRRRRQDGHGREDERAEHGDLRELRPGEPPADRHRRADREGRPRRLGRRADRARLLLALLRPAAPLRGAPQQLHGQQPLMSVIVTRRTRTRPRSRVLSIARRLDWLLLGATAGLTALGLTVLGDATRLDIAGDPGYYVRRQTIYFAVGGIGMVAMAAIDPNLWRRLAAAALRGHALARRRRARARHDDPRLDALDHAAGLPVPALRARQADGHARARGVRRGPAGPARRRARVAAPARLHRDSGRARVPRARPRHVARVRRCRARRAAHRRRAVQALRRARGARHRGRGARLRGAARGRGRRCSSRTRPTA